MQASNPTGLFEAATALVGAVAALIGYLVWTVVRVRRLMRTLEGLLAAHYRMRRYAHRHDKATGRAIPIKWNGQGRYGTGYVRRH